MMPRVYQFGRYLHDLKISLIRPFGAPSPRGRRDFNQALYLRERVAEGRVRGQGRVLALLQIPKTDKTKLIPGTADKRTLLIYPKTAVTNRKDAKCAKKFNIYLSKKPIK
jgi:hypothetical protein